MRGKTLLLVVAALLFASCAQPGILEMNLREHANLDLHIHPYIQIEINGENMTIPDNIGISDKGMRVIHTHENDGPGEIHVESPYPYTFTLKDFFYVWGQTFNSTCVLWYCEDATHELLFYVNGIQSEQYEKQILRDGDRLKIVYGGIQ